MLAAIEKTASLPKIRVACLCWLLATGAVLTGCDSDSDDNNDNTWWQEERADRIAALNEFLLSHQSGFESFRTAPLAIKQDVLNFLGTPMIMFRLMPEIFPDIWGEPEEQLAKFGLGPDPYDTEGFLPLGIGFTLSEASTGVNSNYAVPSCMACHGGGVNGPSGELIRMVGAPTPTPGLINAFQAMVSDSRYTAANFQAALDSKPVGWIYGFNPEYLQQEEIERAIFNTTVGADDFLAEVKVASDGLLKIINETLEVYTYNVANPPLAFGMPGSLDVFSIGAAAEVDVNTMTPAELAAALPAAPGPADVPAAWNMDGRPRFQWDDSIGNLYMREVAASLSVSGNDPAAVNSTNVQLAADFVAELPAYPYPFDVSEVSAKRGRVIYQSACASCHASGNNMVATPAEVGTDPNRANIFTDFSVDALRTALRAACTVPGCFESNGDAIPDSEVLEPTGGYIQIPLAGVWATAPYLHNGSVPTLYHLLTGDRPDTFYRGNYDYDEELAGFVWDSATDSRALLYDTSLDGYSNAGHAGLGYSGSIDWETEPDKLWDLIEYLKTL